jgi:ABC transporter, permease protein
MNNSLSTPRIRNPRLRKLLSKKTAAKWMLALFRTVFIVGICFTILYPLLTKISMSFMDETDLYDRTVKVIAKHFTPENYLEAATYINYGKLLLNTVGLCTVVSLLQALSCTVVGYGFARFHFKGRGILFALVVLCMVVPTQVILTPQYLNFKAMGMLGSFAPFIALGLTGVAPRCGLYIFLARQFFRGVPREIDEAAAIDGAGPYKTFTSIMLKSAIPIMVTIFLFSFVWQWGGKHLHQPVLQQLPDHCQNAGQPGVRPGGHPAEQRQRCIPGRSDGLSVHPAGDGHPPGDYPAAGSLCILPEVLHPVGGTHRYRGVMTAMKGRKRPCVSECCAGRWRPRSS